MEELELIAFQTMRTIQFIMESDKGINTKVNVNTLIDSDIYNDIEFNLDKDNLDIINIMINDYINNIESGRKAGASFIPIEVLAEWASKKNITNDNNVIYAIQQSIHKEGIPARPIMKFAEEEIDKHINDWLNNIFNTLTSYLDEFFNN